MDDHVALGGKDEYFVAQTGPFFRVSRNSFPSRVSLCQSRICRSQVELVVQVVALLLAFLVAPVGRNAVLGHPVHLPSADLHLEGKGHFPSAHHRGVQALVHVGLGYGDVVLEPAGYLIPQGMDDAQHRVAVRHRIHQHADGNQVIDLLKGLVLQHHLPVNGIKVLGPPVDVVAVICCVIEAWRTAPR